MRVLGLDPGALGALALVSVDDGAIRLVAVEDTPAFKIRRGKTEKTEINANGLAVLLQKLRPDVAFMERVGGMPGQSASASFNFGRASGVAEGVLAALGIRTEMIAPTKWKNQFQIRGDAGKDAARAITTRMFPAFASSFARVRDADRAEAALIAVYAAHALGLAHASTTKPEAEEDVFS